MPAVSDIALLSRCAGFTLSHSLKVENEIIEELQTSSQTNLIMALRMLRLQRSILAIGMFSLFESLLQGHMGWSNPFERLNEYLEQCENHELAQKLRDYRLAVNALKHGRGTSYKKLLERPDLEFKVKPSDEYFFAEGDVSEVDVLVDVDDKFVMRCAELIEEASAIIRSREQVWI